MSETIINGIIEESQEIFGRMQYARGAKGDDGIGISDISKTSTVGKVDTYTITLTDGTTKTFTVTNGDDGANGISVSTASINSSGHLIVTLSNGTSVDAGVAKGDTGDSGVYIGTTPPTDPSIKVWIDTSGEAGDVEMTSNKVTSISSESTDIQYPSAKAVANIIGDIDDTFANALKGTASGSSLVLNDVSPVEHTMGVKVRGKNLFDKSIPLDAWEEVGGGYYRLRITVPIGSQITASVLKAYGTDEKKGHMYVRISGKDYWLFHEGNSSLCKKSVTATSTDGIVDVVFTAKSYNSFKDEIMIEINSEATDYTPYISDYTAIPEPYINYFFNHRCVFRESGNETYYAPIYVDKTFEPVEGKTYYVEISDSVTTMPGYDTAGTCTATANGIGGYTLELGGAIRIETCSEGHGETWTSSFRITYLGAPDIADFNLKIGEDGYITKAVKVSRRGKNIVNIPNIDSKSNGSIPCYITEPITISGINDNVVVKREDGTTADIWRIQVVFANGTTEEMLDSHFSSSRTFMGATKPSIDIPITEIKYRNTYLRSGEYKNIQVEYGKNATEYEPYICEDYTTTADGTVNGVTSLYPCTNLATDTDGVIIDCAYNRDINKAFEELQQAIISLGGTV